MKLLFRYDPESGAVTIYTSRAPYFRLQMSSSDVARFLGALPPKPQHPLLTHLKGVDHGSVAGGLLPDSELRDRSNPMEVKQ